MLYFVDYLNTKIITDHGYSAAPVSRHLGISTNTLNTYIKRFAKLSIVVEETMEYVA